MDVETINEADTLDIVYQVVQRTKSLESDTSFNMLKKKTLKKLRLLSKDSKSGHSKILNKSKKLATRMLESMLHTKTETEPPCACIPNDIVEVKNQLSQLVTNNVLIIGSGVCSIPVSDMETKNVLITVLKKVKAILKLGSKYGKSTQMKLLNQTIEPIVEIYERHKQDVNDHCLEHVGQRRVDSGEIGNESQVASTEHGHDHTVLSRKDACTDVLTGTDRKKKKLKKLKSKRKKTSKME